MPDFPSLEQNEVGRVDSDASDRVLPGLMRSDPSVTFDSDEMIWSSVEGEGEDGSWDGVTEPHVEFRFVDDPEDRTGEELPSIPEAIEAASGADASISGIFSPSCRASSASCWACASLDSSEGRRRTSRQYWASSKMGPALRSIMRTGIRGICVA